MFTHILTGWQASHQASTEDPGRMHFRRGRESALQASVHSDKGAIFVGQPLISVRS